VRRITRSTAFAAFAALALLPVACSSRPSGVATQPGDSYAELMGLELEQVGKDIRLKAHYRFPDGQPNPNAWFACTFEINGGANGVLTVRKQGRDLDDEGDFEVTTNAQLLKRRGNAFAVVVKQANAKSGPYHDISARFTPDP
jgi:hypothetical protein